ALGQEAIAAGGCLSLRREDRVVSNYRGHGHCLACGGDPERMMAEVLGRAEGYGRGRLGSLHLASSEIGMLGANAIVGAGSPIAVGAAYAQKAQDTGGITVVFFGDGASDRGTQHEAMNLAALWKLPIIFAVENNGVAYYTVQERHQTVHDISVRAAAYGIAGETVDGNDVMAVAEATSRAAERCRAGEGPVLLEFKTYRYEGHYVGDPCEYRTPEEVERWKAENDPIDRSRDVLLAEGIDAAELDRMADEARAEMASALEYASNLPLPNADDLAQDIFATVSNGSAATEEEPAPEGPAISFSKAARQAITAELERDRGGFCAGEDITWGGTMRRYYGLAAKYPGRILDTPISETAIGGLGVGSAAMGMRPLVDFNLMDFTLAGADEILNQAAKFTALTGRPLPLVMHAASGACAGAALQHSQDLEALFCHVPGIKVVYPSTPADAKGLMTAAIRDDGPVLFIDAMELASVKGTVPEGEHVVPIGRARIARVGNDATVVTYGPMVAHVLEAADALAGEGISVEVIDLRTL
ncbi:MAG: thiamine pyrophosphate-dependent enzyme, partial [Coriobacteriaceae bacterium]|nr:thiamine pyrophosphate-dependent enzyme [Coriobacteriaceae bacterium]